jgi:hypothetical protein
MKYLIILFTSLSMNAFSQVTHWSICINNKNELNGSDSLLNAKPATILIERSRLKANTFLQIEIQEPSSNIAWTRDFIFSSPEQDPLFIKKFEHSAGKFSIPFAEILPKTGKEKEILIYSDQHPANPNLGIRSKRTLLVILQLK